MATASKSPVAEEHPAIRVDPDEKPEGRAAYISHISAEGFGYLV